LTQPILCRSMGIREKLAVHALNEKTGDLLEPLLEGGEESSDDDESSIYSSSPNAAEFKATPMEKLKSFLGKCMGDLFSRVNLIRFD
jgi:hypothetical protein